MVDEIVPAENYPDPHDTPLNQFRPIEEPDHYNPPPRPSGSSTPSPVSAGKPQEKAPIFPQRRAISTPPNELMDRITVTMQAHHEQWGTRPLSFGIQFNDNTEMSDQGLERRLRIPSDRKVLFEWGDYPATPGLIMIENRTGQIQITRKSSAEIQNIRQQCLYVSLCKDCPDEHALIVRPGRGFMAEMQDDTEIWLKSASGICDITVFLFPR